jgi:hypothetical protein
MPVLIHRIAPSSRGPPVIALKGRRFLPRSALPWKINVIAALSDYRYKLIDYYYAIMKMSY